MNRSYSKIRHIREANQNLEKRLIIERHEDIDDIENDGEEVHPALARQLRNFEPDDFTVTGRIKVVQNPPSKTPNFILLSNNKTLSGTRLLNGIELTDYVGKLVKLTGVTKNGEHPSFMNPMKVTKRPQILSDNDPS